jgi:hypothetical protein
MRRLLQALLLAMAATAPMTLAVAGTTHFGIKPIVINGVTAVNVTSINNRGEIAGTYFTNSDGFAGTGFGFERSGQTVTVLPTICTPETYFCSPFPSAINRHGQVVGQLNNAGVANYLFTWQPGQASVTDFLTFGEGTGSFVGRLPLLNDRGWVAFQNNGNVYLGPPGNPQIVNALSSGVLTLTGLNNAGELVGQNQVTIHGKLRGAAFVWTNGQLKELRPPGSVNVRSVAINDAGDVAGSWFDSSLNLHGFVHSHGKFTSFDSPGASSGMIVTGFNNKGRVVGTYVSSTNAMVRGFVYNGETVTGFGTFGRVQSNQVGIVVNDLGVMVVSYMAGDVSDSYADRVVCAGTGC